MGGGEAAGKLREQFIMVSRADPGAQNRRDGERWVETVQMPVQTTNAARNNGTVAGCGLLAVVAQDWRPICIADFVEVRRLLVTTSFPGNKSADMRTMAAAAAEGARPRAARGRFHILGNLGHHGGFFLIVPLRTSSHIFKVGLDVLRQLKRPWIGLVKHRQEGTEMARPLVR